MAVQNIDSNKVVVRIVEVQSTEMFFQPKVHMVFLLPRNQPR